MYHETFYYESDTNFLIPVGPDSAFIVQGDEEFLRIICDNIICVSISSNAYVRCTVEMEHSIFSNELRPMHVITLQKSKSSFIDIEFLCIELTGTLSYDGKRWSITTEPFSPEIREINYFN